MYIRRKRGRNSYTKLSRSFSRIFQTLISLLVEIASGQPKIEIESRFIPTLFLFRAHEAHFRHRNRQPFVSHVAADKPATTREKHLRNNSSPVSLKFLHARACFPSSPVSPLSVRVFPYPLLPFLTCRGNGNPSIGIGFSDFALYLEDRISAYTCAWPYVFMDAFRARQEAFHERWISKPRIRGSGKCVSSCTARILFAGNSSVPLLTSCLVTVSTKRKFRFWSVLRKWAPSSSNNEKNRLAWSM